MNSIDSLSTMLRKQGFRMTPQRLAILKVLSDAGRHLSPSDVYASASKNIPGLTEATVYRTLEFLARQDVVLAAHIGNGKMVYEMAECDHHHLICRACGNTLQIDHALLQKLYEQLEGASGYRLTTSHLTFFGLCPDCKEGGK